MKYIKFILPGIILLTVILIFKMVFYIGYVPTESMEPTIPAQSRIIGIRILGKLEVSDIIVFEHNGYYMVKRIAAVAGDTLEINGLKTKVPEDCYYVIGDNFLNSYDSRYWDNPFIKNKDIIAILFCK